MSGLLFPVPTADNGDQLASLVGVSNNRRAGLSSYGDFCLQAGVPEITPSSLLTEHRATEGL